MNRNEEARARFVAEHDRFTAAAIVMRERLEGILRTAGIRGPVDVREKSVGSFVKKIQTRQYEDPWTDITDKVGGRITLGTSADLARIRAVFERDDPPMKIRSIQDKTAEGDVRGLFYPGVHVQVEVPGETTLDGEPIECEIQLRTEAQDLWSVISHELVYKGAIKPDRATERRVMRLVVLMELFDEEVERAMADLSADPRYERATLLRASEILYLAFVAEPGEVELSYEVLQQIDAALPPDRENYARVLADFVTAERAKIADVLETYGAYSDFASGWNYWLLSQPEVLVVLECVEHRPMALADAVRDTDLEEPVRQAFAVWARQMPDST